MGLYAQSCAAEIRYDGGYTGRGWSRWTIHRWMKVWMDEQVDRQVTVETPGNIRSSLLVPWYIPGVLYWDVSQWGHQHWLLGVLFFRGSRWKSCCLFLSLECPVILRTGFPDMILINSWTPTTPVTWVTLQSGILCSFWNKSFLCTW